MKLKRGFTLIELLVVIAIIGILSAVVLAALSTARNKGSDAAIQSDLNTIQTEAELYYQKNGNSYGATDSRTNSTSCGVAGTMFVSANDATIASAISNADVLAGGTGVSSNIAKVACSENVNGSYVVEATLVNGVNVGGTIEKGWCVDSSGDSNSVNISSGLNYGISQCPSP